MFLFVLTGNKYDDDDEEVLRRFVCLFVCLSSRLLSKLQINFYEILGSGIQICMQEFTSLSTGWAKNGASLIFLLVRSERSYKTSASVKLTQTRHSHSK